MRPRPACDPRAVYYVEGGTVISLANETFKFNGGAPASLRLCVCVGCVCLRVVERVWYLWLCVTLRALCVCVCVHPVCAPPLTRSPSLHCRRLEQ